MILNKYNGANGFEIGVTDKLIECEFGFLKGTVAWGEPLAFSQEVSGNEQRVFVPITKGQEAAGFTYNGTQGHKEGGLIETGQEINIATRVHGLRVRLDDDATGIKSGDPAYFIPAKSPEVTGRWTNKSVADGAIEIKNSRFDLVFSPGANDTFKTSSGWSKKVGIVSINV